MDKKTFVTTSVFMALPLFYFENVEIQRVKIQNNVSILNSFAMFVLGMLNFLPGSSEKRVGISK